MDKKSIGLMDIEAYAIPTIDFMDGSSHVFVVDMSRKIEWPNHGRGWDQDKEHQVRVAKTRSYKEWLYDFVPPGEDFNKCGIIFGVNGICHTIANRVLLPARDDADVGVAANNEHAVIFFGKYGLGINDLKKRLYNSYQESAKQYILPVEALTSTLARVDNFVHDELLTWWYVAKYVIELPIDEIYVQNPAACVKKATSLLVDLVNAREDSFKQYMLDTNPFDHKERIKNAVKKYCAEFLEFLVTNKYITSNDMKTYMDRVHAYLGQLVNWINAQVAAIERGELL